MSVRILVGDCLQRLRDLPDESVHCCVTSPPYWGLRDYGTAEWVGGDDDCDHAAPLRSSTIIVGNASNKTAPNATEPFGEQYRGTCQKCGATREDDQLGLEETPDEYVAKMVEVFREVRRVLRDDGTLWLNLGDSYASSGDRAGMKLGGHPDGCCCSYCTMPSRGLPTTVPTGLKPKDLVGIPWRVAFALQADGWWLRQDIIWQKPNPMPESVRDRCTKAHEYIFLLSKSARYFYDADAIAKGAETAGQVGGFGGTAAVARALASGRQHSGNEKPDAGASYVRPDTRNRRSVWSITTKPFSEAHFATFPPDLPELCIKAGTSEHGVCGQCGAPWERVREKTGGVVSTGGSENNRRNGHTDFGGSDMNCGTFTQHEWHTTGWSPSCECEADPRPATVLDPFGGAGTTGLVADRLKRDAILCELNPEYAQMAERRIYGDAPMFVDVTVEVPDEEAA